MNYYLKICPKCGFRNLGKTFERCRRCGYLLKRVKRLKQSLKEEVARLKDFAESKGWDYEIISGIASGVNEQRRGLRKLLNLVKRGEVEKVVIEYPDRLARFGYKYVQLFLESHWWD